MSAKKTTQGSRRPLGTRRIASNIGAFTLFLNGLGLLTGPLVARALGPDGRGQLAAIASTVLFVGAIADVGLSTYTTREAARGRPLGELLGSVGPIVLVVNLVIAAAAPFVAALVAGGREVVFLFVLLNLLLAPLSSLFLLLNGINWAQQRWTVWTIVRAIPLVGGALVTVTLYLIGELTVVAASVSAIALALVGFLPLLTVLRGGIGPVVFRWEIAREGLSFGVRSWLFGLAALSNGRLDQLLMTRLVSTAQLGFYAVAVNVTVLQGAIRAGIDSAIFPRIASGESALTARACRITLALSALVCLALVPAMIVLLPLLFGEDFAPAVPMAQLLLVASIPQAGTAVLASGLTAAGAPGVAARGEILSLALTVPGLLLLLGPLDATGAALVSLAAYACSFAYLLRRAPPVLGGGWRDYLVPAYGDWAFVRQSPLVDALRRRLRLPSRGD